MKLGVFWRNLGNSAVYYPRLAKATGGVTACIFFETLFHRFAQSNSNNWVKITFEEIENETGLSRIEQELACGQLVERSLLKQRLVSGDSDTRKEFLPDIDALEERLADWEESNVSNTKSAVASHQPNADKAHLRNSANNSYSDITTVGANGHSPLPIIEVHSIGKLEKKNLIDSNGCSTSRNGTSGTDKSCVALGETPTHPADVVVESCCNPTQTVKTDPRLLPQRSSISVKVTPNYQFSGPWKSPEQFEYFQRALLEHFKNKGVDNPGGWVFRIVDGMTKGLISPFWEEFISGIPLGESQKVKRDWEIEPGVAYPVFEEERIQYYIHKGEPLEVAVSKARSDLRNPVLGKDLWEGFLRKCDRIADEALKAKNSGVTTPYLPPSFTNKPQITKQNVMNKLAALAPQFSLSTSSTDSLNDLSLKPQEIEEERAIVCDVPTLSTLQQAYKTSMGRTLVQRQIAEHPEWGYGIVDGQVIDLIPF